MADEPFIITQINVDGTDKCPEKKDAVNNWWWTDAVLGVDGSEVNSTKWQVDGGNNDFDKADASIGVIPCPGTLNVVVGWDLTNAGPVSARLSLWDNANGGSTDFWNWSSGDTGNTNVSVDISNLGACGGYLRLYLFSSNSSHYVTFEIDEFS